jgi:hypothetical protein
VQINSTTGIFLSHASNAESVRRRIVEDWHFNGREASLFRLDYEIVTSDRLDRESQQQYIARHPQLPLVDALEGLAMEKRRAWVRRKGQAVESQRGVVA